jgi:hypothetical protein
MPQQHWWPERVQNARLPLVAPRPTTQAHPVHVNRSKDLHAKPASFAPVSVAIRTRQRHPGWIGRGETPPGPHAPRPEPVSANLANCSASLPAAGETTSDTAGASAQPRSLSERVTRWSVASSAECVDRGWLRWIPAWAARNDSSMTATACARGDIRVTRDNPPSSPTPPSSRRA